MSNQERFQTEGRTQVKIEEEERVAGGPRGNCHLLDTREIGTMAIFPPGEEEKKGVEVQKHKLQTHLNGNCLELGCGNGTISWRKNVHGMRPAQKKTGLG